MAKAKWIPDRQHAFSHHDASGVRAAVQQRQRFETCDRFGVHAQDRNVVSGILGNERRRDFLPLGDDDGEEARLAQSPSQTLITEFPLELSGEQHIPIIDALTNDHEGSFQVNVMNHGAVPGFGEDLVVEVPGVVNGGGVKAIQVQRFPKALIHHIQRTQIIPMELGLEAFTTGNLSVLTNKVLADHRTQSYEQAQNVIDAVFALPFNTDLQVHFS